jgi:hypothetical protein
MLQKLGFVRVSRLRRGGTKETGARRECGGAQAFQQKLAFHGSPFHRAARARSPRASQVRSAATARNPCDIPRARKPLGALLGRGALCADV